jgi:hypothetical protein
MTVADLKFPEGLNPLTAVANVPLGSESVKTKLLEVPLAPNQSYSFGDDSQLTLNLGGSLAVFAFNSPDDADDDKILAAAPAETPAGKLAPQLALTPDAAWLKYALKADVKAAGGGTLAGVGFSVDAAAGAVVADYRRHTRPRPLLEALTLDFAAGPRFATVLEHVRDLSTGEALSLRWLGTLRASVEVAWSDVFAGPALSLAKLAGVRGVIGIKLTAAARVAFSVDVSDDFFVVFSRLGDNEWRIGVRKATSRAVGARAGVGITAEFADPKAAEAVLNEVVEGVIGRPPQELNEILSKASLDQLSDAQRKAAAFLIKRVGLQEEVATLDNLRDRVQEIQDAVPDAIRQIAKTKIGLAFAYEYNRIDEHTNVLQATLSGALLDKHHGSLIRGRLEALTSDIAAHLPGTQLETYLNQKTLTRERSWGFTLGIGKWVDIGGKDFRRVVRTERRNINGRLQENYLGTRGYKGKWIGDTFAWTVDLKADMHAFAVHDVPLVTEFAFGLHLVWTASQKTLSPDECDQWLDGAVVWRVLPEMDLDHGRERLSAMLNRGCEVTLQVAVPDDALRTMLPSLAVADSSVFAPALATAMPWQKGGGRTSASRRRELYSPLWALYLREPHMSPGDLSRAGAAHFEKQQLRELAFAERRFDAVRPFTVAGLVELNDDTHGACTAFTRGAAMLQSAITSGAPNQKTIDKVFETMNDLWTHSHHVRTIGAYLLESATAAGVLNIINRTMTVRSGDDVVVLSA